MYLVWTPRVAKASGFYRDLKSPKGGIGALVEAKCMVEEKVIGYFRELKFYEGGKAGKGGQVMDWCMCECFDSEGSGNKSVICMMVFENVENKKYSDAFEEALKVLEKNATALRGMKL
ncbi:hypothetical protein Tco_0766285 [Tanacetum coccineum]